MQKRAFSNDFKSFFDSIPIAEQSPIYADKENIKLPISPISSLHYHNKIEIGLCYEGSGLFYSSLKSEYINKGDIIFFLPGVAHYSQSLHIDNTCQCRFAFIDAIPLLFSLFKEKETGINLLSAAQTFDIPAIIRKNEFPTAYNILNSLLFDIFNDTNNLYFLTSIHLAEFFIKIPSFFEQSIHTENTPLSKQTDIIYVAESFISAHYNEPINTTHLCDICGLSESQLRRRYKKIFGTSPLAYLHSLRCNIATQLLCYTTLSVNQIAHKIGYLDNSEFYKHFYRINSCSPTNYRKKHSKLEKDMVV